MVALLRNASVQERYADCCVFIRLFVQERCWIAACVRVYAQVQFAACVRFYFQERRACLLRCWLCISLCTANITKFLFQLGIYFDAMHSPQTAACSVHTRPAGAAQGSKQINT